ncbi:MAG: sigma 54-interacting transcriptional regulator [Myxococcota bacterium]
MSERNSGGPVAGAPSARPGGTQMMPPLEMRRIEKLQVTVVASPDASAVGTRKVFVKDELRIGSDPGLDLTVSDPMVSREHLAVWGTERGWRLRDLGSTNGTYIGAIRVDRATVFDAVDVRLGTTHLRIEPLGEHVEHEMSAEHSFGRMIGDSPSMREMFAILQKVAATDMTVLIEGETGTGKELAAEGVHEASGRNGAFITLNCGAIPRELIESELMGHVRGAFTGAVSDRPGAFTSAHGGTLFLDEVGELPLDMQAKLLRVLERREVKPVGSDKTQSVDVRVVAATNRNLNAESERGEFRHDLYFRLAVVVVRIPPLRTRPEDVDNLVDHIQGELNRRRVAAGRPPLPPLGDQALAMLKRYEFPGNVRELRNIVERWSVLGPQPSPGQPSSGPAAAGPVAAGAAERQEDLAVDASLLEVPYHEAKEVWVERFERAYVTTALEQAGGNVSQAARDAKVDRRHLQRLMARYDIKRR